MFVDVVLGLQWGDEGKGKIVDYLAPGYHIIARFQGGPNAGHTLNIEGKKYVLHTIPSGIFHDGIINFIGNGVVLDPGVFYKEVEQLTALGIDVRKSLFISDRVNLILPTHKALDAASEAQKGAEKIGSTLRGIGPAYMDKTGRNGLRVGDIFQSGFQEKYQRLRDKHHRLLQLYDLPSGLDLEGDEESWRRGIELLRSLQVVNGPYFLNEQLDKGRKILAEGAQGSLLDIDFGTYPFVTSSNTISAAVCTGTGISPLKIRKVIGVSKAYTTRVGSGPFPTEEHGETGERLRQEGNEFGATTGRPRRCGWLDLPALRYTVMLNGVTELVLTKADVLNRFGEIKICTHYKIHDKLTRKLPFDLTDTEIIPQYRSFEGWLCDLNKHSSWSSLPGQLSRIITFIEENLEVPVQMISTGPGREELIIRQTAANTI